MNQTNVQNPDTSSPRAVLDAVADILPTLPGEVRKAAAYVLENPNEIGICSIREMAVAAGVKPNTFVRMARSAGFGGYDDFRTVFREELRHRQADFPDRARWLQSLPQKGELSGLYADMAASSLANIEQMFSSCDAANMQSAAQDIVQARMTYVLGVGVGSALARNFAYLASMALDTVRAIPSDAALPVDGLVQAEEGDLLIAMTIKPFRREVIEAVDLADRMGMTVMAISDTPAAPIFQTAKHRFVLPTETPQFFSSTLAIHAFFETLMAFVIAQAPASAVESIERFHERRQMLGIYVDGGQERGLP
tara:strand:- start:320 stop:1243 length:924 start_codon:yes stop_codon:yes gene_type:complete